jgi:hypothetical protein
MMIQASHPRLFWTPGRIATAKAWATQTGYSARSDDFQGQAFSHVVKNTDCKAAIDYAMSANLAQMNGSAACDQCRFVGEQAILIFDWCYDQMTSSQISTFTNNFDNWLGFWMTQDWGGSKETDQGTFEQNNYFWGYFRNEIEMGLASYPENQAMAESLLTDAFEARWANRFLPAALTSSRGGVAQEGTQYGNYLIGYPVIAMQTAAIAGRDMWTETNFYKEAVFYLIYATLYQQTASSYSETGFALFPFSEDEQFPAGHEAETGFFGDFMLAAANRWGGVPVGGFARSWLNTVKPNLSDWQVSVDGGGNAGNLDTLPLDYYASGMQYLWAHSKAPWSASTTMFFQMGGPASNVHFNQDAGAFQIWRGGRWLSRQTVGYINNIAGYANGSAVDTQKPVGHNSVLVNGQGLASGYPFDVQGLPVVHRLQSDPAFSFASVDLTPSYHGSAGAGSGNAAAVHVERDFIFVRSLETLVILDRVQSDTAARTKTFLLHSETMPSVEDTQHVTLTNGSQALRMTTLVPSAPTVRIVNEKGGGGTSVGQYRVEVDTSPGTEQSYILTVLQAKDAAAAPLAATVSSDASSFTVSLGSSATVKLQNGMTSSGGSVTVGGTTVNLRADVQSLSVTDAGPVWGN